MQDIKFLFMVYACLAEVVSPVDHSRAREGDNLPLHVAEAMAENEHDMATGKMVEVRAHDGGTSMMEEVAGMKMVTFPGANIKDCMDKLRADAGLFDFLSSHSTITLNFERSKEQAAMDDINNLGASLANIRVAPFEIGQIVFWKPTDDNLSHGNSKRWWGTILGVDRAHIFGGVDIHIMLRWGGQLVRFVVPDPSVDKLGKVFRLKDLGRSDPAFTAIFSALPQHLQRLITEQI